MKRLILFLSLLTISISVIAQKPYFQQKVDVKMDVVLDDQKHLIDGNIEMNYTNNSPDELDFIYLNLWANAYKDRTTAFSKQELRFGRTNFYFAKDSLLGNFSELDFKVDGKTAVLEFDKENPDIAKLILNKPIRPKETINITSPFVLKIPASFSRLGHVGESYQMTQWFPKPAVYDRDGWHPMPYLSAGEYYSEFGDYEVAITLPDNYVVAATGTVQEATEIEFLNEKVKTTNKLMEGAFENDKTFPASSTTMKTITFIAENVHDFAWFADKRFHVQKNIVTMESGNKVDTWAFFTNVEADLWRKGNFYVDRSLEFYSKHVGEYPWPHATAVQSALSAGGGMEYPMITVIGAMGKAQPLDEVITHEVGHNWFYGILAFNERDHAWLDEGINSYYDHRYSEEFYPDSKMEDLPKFIVGDSDLSIGELAYLYQARKNKDQAPNLHSDDFTMINYFLSAYEKPAISFKILERFLGTEKFDSIMKSFYSKWKFKHPGPDDFKNHVLSQTDKDLSWFFDDLIGSDKKTNYAITKLKKDNAYKVTVKNKGEVSAPFPLTGMKDGKVIRKTWFEGFEGARELLFEDGDYDKIVLDGEKITLDVDRKDNNIKTSGVFKTLEPLRLRFLAGIENPEKRTLYYTPYVSWNNYDKGMLGLALYNSTIPERKFEFALAPAYSFVTNKVNGVGNVKYHWYPKSGIPKVTFDIGMKRYNFNYNWRHDYYQEYKRIHPSITIALPAQATSNFSHGIKLRSLLIQEDEPKFNSDGTFITTVGAESAIHEISYFGRKNTALTPTTFQVALEQQRYKAFEEDQNYLKLSLEATRSYVYKKGRKIQARIFAGGFLNNTRKNAGSVSNSTTRGTFPMTAQGFNDYKYDDFFLGRTDQDGIWSQQIALNNGGFKNAFGSAYSFGQSNNFIIALNLKSDLPMKLPRFLPLKPYFDIGYFDNAQPTGSDDTFKDQLMWSGGLMLDYGNGAFGIYLPLVNSENITNIYKQRSGSFAARIAFSFDLHKMNPYTIINNLNF